MKIVAPVWSKAAAITLVLVAASVSAPALAAPTVLDMNLTPSDWSAGVTSQGFRMASTGGFTFIGNSSSCWPQCAHNGSNYVFSGNAVIGVSSSLGATFDLNSFGAAESHVGFPSLWASAIRVVGRYADGDTVSSEFALDGVNDGTGPLVDFQTFWLPSSFSGLMSVSFSAVDSNYRQFALDNIALNGSFQGLSRSFAVTSVAEPGSVALTCAALMLAAAALRVRRSPTLRLLQA